MDFKIELKGLEEAKKILDQRRYKRAVTFALKRAVNSGRTEASEQIRKGEKPFALLKSDVDRKMNVRLPNPYNAVLKITSGPWILSYFKPRQIVGGKSAIKRTKKKGFELIKGTGRKNSGGVSIEIVKGRRVTLKHAFIATGKGGTPLVFWRKKGDKSSTTNKDKLAALKVYSLPSMFKKPAVLGKVIDKIKTQWEKEITSAINRIISGKWNAE